VFVVNKSAVWPKYPADLFAGQNFTGPLQKHKENLKGLRVQLYTNASAAKFSADRVNLEDSKAIASGRLLGRHVFRFSIAKRVQL
jgi:hypothetical protein